MSYDGWLMYGDRGPIIGKWPVEIVSAPRPLEAGSRVVIENGLIREAKGEEYGAYLPDGARIDGSHLEVPEWWWKLHFAELLAEPPPDKCCGEGGVSREECADCPLLGRLITEEPEPEFDFGERDRYDD